MQIQHFFHANIARPGLMARTSDIPRITAMKVVDMKKLRACNPMRFKFDTSMLARPIDNC